MTTTCKRRCLRFAWRRLANDSPCDRALRGTAKGWKYAPRLRPCLGRRNPTPYCQRNVRWVRLSWLRWNHLPYSHFWSIRFGQTGVGRKFHSISLKLQHFSSIGLFSLRLCCTENDISGDCQRQFSWNFDVNRKFCREDRIKALLDCSSVGITTESSSWGRIWVESIEFSWNPSNQTDLETTKKNQIGQSARNVKVMSVEKQNGARHNQLHSINYKHSQ